MRNASALKCPDCNGTDLKVIGPLHGVQVFAGRRARIPLPDSKLYLCRECELRFRTPILSAHEYDHLYDNDEALSWADTTDRVDWSLITRYLSANVPVGASILDFGCYTGGLLGRLDARYSRKGIEINAAARALASERLGAEMLPSLEAVPPGEKYDVVTAVDVIEHFPDPGRMILALLSVLKVGGVLIITTGDSDSPFGRAMGSRWWYCFFPEHLSFISERWARRWLSTTKCPATLVTVERFRHVRLTVLRYASQVVMSAFYILAPDLYVRLIEWTKRMIGRDPAVHPPGAGLTRDHIFLVIRKTGIPV